MITHPKVGGIGPSKSVTHTRPPTQEKSTMWPTQDKAGEGDGCLFFCFPLQLKNNVDPLTLVLSCDLVTHCQR